MSRGLRKMCEERWMIWVGCGEDAKRVPVVPCDSAAIDRGAEAAEHVFSVHGDWKQIAEAVLEAAGETP